MCVAPLLQERAQTPIWGAPLHSLLKKFAKQKEYSRTEMKNNLLVACQHHRTGRAGDSTTPSSCAGRAGSSGESEIAWGCGKSLQRHLWEKLFKNEHIYIYRERETYTYTYSLYCGLFLNFLRYAPCPKCWALWQYGPISLPTYPCNMYLNCKSEESCTSFLSNGAI